MQNDKFKPVLDTDAALPSDQMRAWRFFQKGYPLRVWRIPCPHNWWIGRPSNPAAVAWHWSGRDLPSPIFFAAGKKLPNESGQRLGARVLTDTWVFDQALYDQLVQRWEAAKHCAADFNGAGTLPLAPRDLNPEERWLAATLKRKGILPMLPDDAQPMLTLCRMGLATVAPEGYARPTECLRKTAVPRVDERIDVGRLTPTMVKLTAALASRLVEGGLDLEHRTTKRVIHWFGSVVQVYGDLSTVFSSTGLDVYKVKLWVTVGVKRVELASGEASAPRMARGEYFGKRRDEALRALKLLKMDLERLDVRLLSEVVLAEYTAQGHALAV